MNQLIRLFVRLAFGIFVAPIAYCISALLNLCFSSFSWLLLSSVCSIRPSNRSRKRRSPHRGVEECLAQIESLASQISLHIRANFLVQPCTRCHEKLMSLVQVSPNARSVKCRCDNCGKGYWAAAANRDALALKDFASDLEDLKERYIHLAKIGPQGRAEGAVHCREHRRPGGVLVKRVQAQRAGAAGSTLHVEIAFTTPEVLLPSGRTPREPIPLSTQAEVLRRDGWKCVVCESKHNLQFAHMIPAPKGGASAKNLQLLCQTCHLKKQSKDTTREAPPC